MGRKSVGICYNPIAGKGRAVTQSKDLAGFLEQKGFSVSLECSDAEGDRQKVKSLAQSVDVLVVAGGDGTLLRMLPGLIECETPIYMLPVGNESLFAREFAMSSTSEEIAETFQNGIISRHSVPTCNGNPFFSMASVGFDSCVIQRVATLRKGPIRHRGYLRSILTELSNHTPPCLSVYVDGECVVKSARGFVIAANNKQYALGIRFVPEADSSRSNLTVRFFPYRNVFGLISVAVSRACGCSIDQARCPVFSGQEIRIETESSELYPVQADGEFLGETPVLLAAQNHWLNVLSRPTRAR